MQQAVLANAMQVENQIWLKEWAGNFLDTPALKKASDELLSFKAQLSNQPVEIQSKYLLKYAFELTRQLLIPVALSDDKEAHNLIQNHGFERAESGWIIGRTRLLKLFSDINSSGKYILNYRMAYILIDMYLTAYLLDKLSYKLKIISRDSGMPVSAKWASNEILKTEKNFRNRARAGTESVKSEFDSFLNDLMHHSDAISSFKISGNSLFKTIKKWGTKSGYQSYIIPIFTDASQKVNPKVSTAEAYRIYYPLYATLLFEEQWPKTDAEFNLYKKWSGNTFNEFQVRALRKFITKQ